MSRERDDPSLDANAVSLRFRTKQEIEADYQRRKIVKKFRKRIQKFENSEMDAEMDLKKGETFPRERQYSIEGEKNL